MVVWTGFSAIATAAQWAADRLSLLSTMMASANPWLSGLVLIAAGLFQFGPLKHACLRRCRTPMGFILTEWRPGTGGVFVTGLRHGVYCVGCCWALMALFFVFGTMNLVAAAGLAALVFAEKALPGGTVIARIFGIGFAAAGSCAYPVARLSSTHSMVVVATGPMVEARPWSRTQLAGADDESLARPAAAGALVSCAKVVPD